VNSAEQFQIQGASAGAIAASVEAAVRSGRLSAGAALPTVRALADELRVSPSTAAAAYRMLRERGVLVTAGRRGTRVSPAPPIRTRRAPTPPAGARDLASGNPDPALLPSLGPHLRKLDPHPRLYAEDTHLPELLDAAREQFRGERVPVGALAIVGGALDGIERVLQASLRPGDRVAVEDPGFPAVFHLLRALGLGLLPVAVDDAGPLPAALEGALASGARALILTPRAQNPTGAVLDAARVRELRGLLAHAPELLVIEDDHAAAAAGAPARTLCRDREHYAIVRSVSKTLGPDLRLAFLAGDAQTVARVEGRQMLGTRWVSHLLQELVLRLMRDPGTPALLEGAADTIARRRQALLDALAERGIAAHGRSGLNVWVPVAEETAVIQQLAAADFAAQAGEIFRLETPPAIRITTAALPLELVPRLADALGGALRRGRSSSAA
jgi:DNA-binding transcriptional MocR family regulator